MQLYLTAFIDPGDLAVALQHLACNKKSPWCYRSIEGSLQVPLAPADDQPTHAGIACSLIGFVHALLLSAASCLLR